MKIEIIFVVLLLHWIADFIFQDEKWSINKSYWIEPLLKHTITYSLIMGLGMMLFFPTFLSFIYFTIITFISHTFVDYFTSIVVKDKFNKKEFGSSIPNFGAFTIIGYDQLLHYVMLFYSLTYLL